MDIVRSHVPVFIVPPPGSALRLEQIKQQMEAYEGSIASLAQQNKPVPQHMKDSLAFLKAQHDNIELWQQTITPQPFPGGITFVDTSGQTIYKVELPDGAPPPEAPVKPDEPPSFPDIEPIKTIVPIRPRRTGKPFTSSPNVTVTILNPPKTTTEKKSKKKIPPAVQQAVITGRRSTRKLLPIPDFLPQNIERMINGNLVVNEPNGAVRINGNLYIPEAFRWWKDPNDNKFFVYLPVSVWNKSADKWAMRIVFDVPGVFTVFCGFPSYPCFERVGNLHALVDSQLSLLWYVQRGANFPRATVERTRADALHFPLPENFDGYKKGDSVYVERDRHQRGYVQDVYVLPDQRRVYLILAASAEVPDFRLGVSPWMETLMDEHLKPPRVSWTTLPVRARWWHIFDLNNPRYITGYWPVPRNGWEVGHFVSVPVSVLNSKAPRAIAKIVFISENKESATVIFPFDPANPEQVFKSKISLAHLTGPPVGTSDFASLDWPSEFDRPVSPVDIGSAAIEGVGKRILVLSDPSTCMPPAKVAKIDGPKKDNEELDVSSFFSDV